MYGQVTCARAHSSHPAPTHLAIPLQVQHAQSVDTGVWITNALHRTRIQIRLGDPTDISQGTIFEIALQDYKTITKQNNLVQNIRYLNQYPKSKPRERERDTDCD